jgi:hypothetical protein
MNGLVQHISSRNGNLYILFLLPVSFVLKRFTAVCKLCYRRVKRVSCAPGATQKDLFSAVLNLELLLHHTERLDSYRMEGRCQIHGVYDSPSMSLSIGLQLLPTLWLLIGWLLGLLSICVGKVLFFFCFYSRCSHLEHRGSVKLFVSLQFQSVGLLGREISPSQGRYLTQTQNKHRHPCLEWDSNPWSRCWSGRRYKNLPLQGLELDLSAVQPVASRYIDCAILVLLLEWYCLSMNLHQMYLTGCVIRVSLFVWC